MTFKIKKIMTEFHSKLFLKFFDKKYKTGIVNNSFFNRCTDIDNFEKNISNEFLIEIVKIPSEVSKE